MIKEEIREKIRELLFVPEITQVRYLGYDGGALDLKMTRESLIKRINDNYNFMYRIKAFENNIVVETGTCFCIERTSLDEAPTLLKAYAKTIEYRLELYLDSKLQLIV